MSLFDKGISAALSLVGSEAVTEPFQNQEEGPWQGVGSFDENNVAHSMM